MEFNFITNIETCFSLVRDTVNLPLVYYSHIPSALISLFIGTVVLIKNRTLLGRILFSISAVFSLWVFLSLVTWTSYNSVNYMFAWSFFGILTSLLFILTIYFTYVFLFKRDVKVWIKWLFLLPLLPILILTPTIHNLPSFDGVWCLANEGTAFTTYYFIFGIFALLFAPILLFKRLKQTKDKSEKKEDSIFTVGICLFILMFFFTGFLASYLADIGAFSSYNYELYGLFGMVIFMGFLGYLIVKFKAFDIKLIGAQALVWALVIMVGSEFMFVRGLSMTIQILVAVTLVISSILGLILVRSVKKEVAQREHIEKIAGELKISNEGQENLIHIMNHQIKGFLGKARYIFAEFLEGDTFGKMPEEAAPALKEGLRATTDGVNYVTEILRGANASKGTLVFDKKPMDVKVVTEELIPEMEPLAKEWKVALEGTTGPGDYQIIGDRMQLKEAFKNLITNAIRYNDPDYDQKSVKVSLSRIGDKILFSVRDTGKGIAPEDKARLFKAGGVGKNSLKQNADATGFGLSFVKGCVLSHDGIVDYKSNAPEKGTTFFIELPTNPAAEV